MPALFNEVVRIVEKANERDGAAFGVTSFHCLRLPTREAENKPGELEMNIRGKVTVPPEADTTEAYERLKDRLVGGLKNSVLLARAAGKTQFDDGERLVTDPDAKWTTLLKSGDQIVAHKDGIWYNVDTVKSDSELLLSQPFAGGDLTSEYSVTRVDVVEWSQRTLRFYIQGQVPAENITPADARPDQDE